MPRGARHTETGWLNQHEGQHILRRDEGGRWRLEMGPFTRWRSRKMVGKRVMVVGERDEFDLLAVKRIEAI